MKLKKNFNWLKEKNNLSFNKIYLATGISISTLQVLVHGDQNNIRIETLIKLCNFFRINIDDFIFSDIEKNIDEIVVRFKQIDSLNLQKNVRYLKEKNKLSYRDICVSASINENTLHILLNGNDRNTRIETVVKLAEYFEKNIDELVSKDIDSDTCIGNTFEAKEGMN